MLGRRGRRSQARGRRREWGLWRYQEDGWELHGSAFWVRRCNLVTSPDILNTWVSFHRTGELSAFNNVSWNIKPAYLLPPCLAPYTPPTRLSMRLSTMHNVDIHTRAALLWPITKLLRRRLHAKSKLSGLHCSTTLRQEASVFGKTICVQSWVASVKVCLEQVGLCSLLLVLGLGIAPRGVFAVL